VNELLGAVNKELTTLLILKVRFVAALAIESILTFKEVVDSTVHLELIPEFVNEHVEFVKLNCTYVGKVITMYDPTINLFIFINHKLYVVTLPIFGT